MQQYPKAWEKLRVFYTKKLKNVKTFLIKDIPKEEREDLIEDDNDALADDFMLEAFIIHNRRALYDFFDEEGCQISINYLGSFFPKIDGDLSDERMFPTREQAENYIFNKAMEVLESKLWK